VSSSERLFPDWGIERPRARIKQEPEDFLVEEILGFEPDGEGEHLWLWIEKRQWNTADVARQIQRAFEVPLRAVSWSGLKDKQAVTRQWFGVHLPGREVELEALNVQGIRVLRAQRHSRKLRNGTHRANRFTVRLRAQQPTDWAALFATLEPLLLSQGFCNYFGAQRFGRDDNLQQATAALLSARRRKRLSAHKRGLFLSAMRAEMFNTVLRQRVEEQLWQRLLPGDVVMLDGSQSVFCVEQVDLELEQRLQRMDLHISGPMYGDSPAQSVGVVAQREQRVLQQFVEWQPVFEHFRMKSSRRAFRAQALDWKAWETEGDAWIEVTLGRGSYCTVLLEHFTRIETAENGVL